VHCSLVAEASSSLRIVHANASLVALYNGWLKKINPNHDEKKNDVHIVGQRLADVFDFLGDNCIAQSNFTTNSRNVSLHLGLMKPEAPTQGASVSLFPVNVVLKGKHGIMRSRTVRERKRCEGNPMKSLRIRMRPLEVKPSHLLIQFNCTTGLEPLCEGGSRKAISNGNPGFRMVG
jgi:hypothetical protein